MVGRWRKLKWTGIPRAISPAACVLLAPLLISGCGGGGDLPGTEGDGFMYYSEVDGYVRIYNTPYGDKNYLLDAPPTPEGEEERVFVSKLADGKIEIRYAHSGVKAVLVDGEEIEVRKLEDEGNKDEEIPDDFPEKPPSETQIEQRQAFRGHLDRWQPS